MFPNRLILLAVGLVAGFLTAACQSPSSQAPTPDVPATMTALLQEQVATVPTLPPLPTHTPYPTATAYPTYTPYPTATSAPANTPTPVKEITKEVVLDGVYPTPVLDDVDTLPVAGADGLYDLGFGQIMFLHVPDHEPSGVFAPRPFRTIFVYPPGRDWADREEWSVSYVRLKCATFLELEDHDAAHGCVIVQ